MVSDSRATGGPHGAQEQPRPAETNSLEDGGCSSGDESEGGGSSSSGPAAFRGPPRVLMLAVLAMIFVSNQACRALPFYIVDFSHEATSENAVNVALHFGSGGYGFLATAGFTLPFTVASLFAGVIADSSDRMCLSGIAGVTWAVVTLCMSAATTYQELLALRILMGLSQAITNPAALALIADVFPDARATMSSVFGLGIYFGTGLASLGAALDGHLGWRLTCVAFGTASLATSLPAFFAKDPRSSAPARAEPGTRKLWRTSLAAPRAYLAMVGHRVLEATESKAARWMLLASTLRFCAGFGILVWLPSAMHSRFPTHFMKFSVYNSLIKAIVGGASSLGGGVIADGLRKHGFGDRGGAVFCAVSSLASAPLWYLVLYDGFSFESSMGFLLFEYLVAESWLGPAVATLQSAVPEDRRGAAQGIFSSLTALGNALPAGLGFLSPDELVTGLQASVALCYVLSFVCFTMALLYLPPVPLTTG